MISDKPELCFKFMKHSTNHIWGCTGNGGWWKAKGQDLLKSSLIRLCLDFHESLLVKRNMRHNCRLHTWPSCARYQPRMSESAIVVLSMLSQHFYSWSKPSVSIIGQHYPRDTKLKTNIYFDTNENVKIFHTQYFDQNHFTSIQDILIMRMRLVFFVSDKSSEVDLTSENTFLRLHLVLINPDKWNNEFIYWF